jgi:two-component system chemotaxis sensor kinase CheA
MDELDLNQFKEIFCSEAKEHLAMMNASLLQLEKNPKDRDMLNEIFRAAHTLKGMAATVGFDKITQLTHEMENVLEKLRKGKQGASDETVEVLFNCFDSLGSLVDEASSGEDRGIDVSGLLIKLKYEIDTKTADFPDADDTVTVLQAPPLNPKANEAAPAPSIEAAPPTAAGEAAPHVADARPESRAVDDKPQEIIDSALAKVKTQAVRIKIEYLDRLMNLVGELVINGARLQQVGIDNKIAELSVALAQFERISIDLQEEVLKTRMVPVRHIFDRYPRMVRDLAKRLNKDIEFQMIGSDIEIDRSLLEEINEPLVHLLRNSVDHGIESSETRKKAGKIPVGEIKLIARRERGYCIIEVNDNGKGMAAEDIRAKAVERGIVSIEEAKSLSENEVFMLICHPAFSMASEITDISGRGVGMDAVRHLVESFSGKLEIKSKKGEGSSFIMQLPLTLAIIQALLVRVGSKEVYAVPLTSVSEIARIDPEYVKTIELREFFMLRNEVIPLVRLDRSFEVERFSNVARPAPQAQPTSSLGDKYAVIVEISGKKTGLVVSSLIGQRQIVIKTLTGILRHTRNFSGATILGNGRVIMILDVGSLYG